MLSISICLAILIFVVLSIVLIQTARFTSQKVHVEPALDIAIDGQISAEHLARAIQFQTISYQDPAMFNRSEFLAFHHFLEKTFPRVHSSLKKEVVEDFSLLFTWEGEDQELKPILLMAHMDIVPVALGTEDEWTYPPFEGSIAGGHIWGRGAIDDKASLLGILEAVEWLLQEGFKPQRTVYIAFGHDEEVGGKKGASQIAALLHLRGVELEYVLDEGLVIIDGGLLGISKTVALVGIAEKGYLSVELTVESEGGHSSMPSKNNAIEILSSIIHKLVVNEMPARIESPIEQMCDYIGREMKFLRRMIFVNRWLFAKIIKRFFDSSLATKAFIRTVSTPTLFESGIKENVQPTRARAIVNFRILTGDSIAGIIEHVKKTANDPRIKVRLLEAFKSEPSPISDTDSSNFNLLQRTIRQIFPEVLIAPGLVIAASDSRHYSKLSSDIYSFVPIRVGSEDISKIHGTNERISVENYKEITKFYIQLIWNSAQ